jgi:hypothetical protein
MPSCGPLYLIKGGAMWDWKRKLEATEVLILLVLDVLLLAGTIWLFTTVGSTFLAR